MEGCQQRGFGKHLIGRLTSRESSVCVCVCGQAEAGEGGRTSQHGAEGGGELPG